MSVTASCRFPFLEEWKTYCDKNRICGFVDSVLSGYAQLAFNDNTFSGILMIIATWIGSPVICICAIWSTITATITAHMVHVPKDQIRAGIYGANAALSGLAVQPLLFPEQSLSFAMLGVSSLIAIMTVVLNQILGKYFAKWDFPTLVIPYCIALLLFLAIYAVTGISGTTEVSIETLLFTCNISDWSFQELVTTFLSCASEILWLVKPASGILYLIALTFASRRDAINTIIAIITSIFVSILLGLPKDAVMTGLYGYNAILLMQVLSRSFLFNTRSYFENIVMVALTPVMCCIYQLLLTPLGIGSFLALPYLTICYYVIIFRKRSGKYTYVSARYWGVPETIAELFSIKK